MQRLRVASYNIRKAVGLDWKRNASRIQDVLGELKADIVLLQEADKRLGTRAGVLSPVTLLQQYGYRFADVAKRELSHGWHGNAILYRSPLRLVATERINIPQWEPRGAVGATFALDSENAETVKDGQPHLRIIGAHLSLFRKMRFRQLRALVEHAKSSPTPTVVGGDFNEGCSDGALEKKLPGAHTFVAPGLSFHSSRPLWTFDRFLLAGRDINIQGSYVHVSDKSRRASDHLPVCLEICLTCSPSHE